LIQSDTQIVSGLRAQHDNTEIETRFGGARREQF